MTHKPPLPEAATPPWPATLAPHVSHAETTETDAADDETGRIAGMDKRVVAGVAGIAVGSAAIAAALLFSGRLNRPKSASAPVPPRPTAGPSSGDAHPAHGNAADIAVD